jgi:hypothetical protein
MVMNKPSLINLAVQARTRKNLLAGMLAAFQEQENMDEQALATYLSCGVADLPRLALCHRPRPAPKFRGDVEKIAEYSHVSFVQLAKLIRAVEARETDSHVPTIYSQTLLAARDHDGEELPASNDDDDNGNTEQ